MISRFINPVTITVGLTTIGTLIGIGIENAKDKKNTIPNEEDEIKLKYTKMEETFLDDEEDDEDDDEEEDDIFGDDLFDDDEDDDDGDDEDDDDDEVDDKNVEEDGVKDIVEDTEEDDEDDDDDDEEDDGEDDDDDDEDEDEDEEDDDSNYDIFGNPFAKRTKPIYDDEDDEDDDEPTQVIDIKTLMETMNNNTVKEPDEAKLSEYSNTESKLGDSKETEDNSNNITDIEEKNDISDTSRDDDEDDEADDEVGDENVEGDDVEDIVEDTEEDEEDDEEEDEEIDEDEEENSELYDHVSKFIDIMNDFDDSVSVMVENDPSEDTFKFKDSFDKYYSIIVPYAELITVAHEKYMITELRPMGRKFYIATMKMIDDIIGDINNKNALGIGAAIKYELEQIMQYVTKRLRDCNDWVVYDDIIKPTPKKVEEPKVQNPDKPVVLASDKISYNPPHMIPKSLLINDPGPINIKLDSNKSK